MDLAPLALFGALVVAAYCTAYLALWVLSRVAPASSPTVFQRPPEDGTVLLFEDETLVNASDDAEHLLQQGPETLSDWQRLVDSLKTRFPTLGATRQSLPEAGRMELVSPNNSERLIAEWKNGLARISILARAEKEPRARIDRASLFAMERELETLRATAEFAPFLVWRQATDGRITWANNAYISLAGKGRPAEQAASWPPARLFDPEGAAPPENGAESRRITIHVPGEATCRWYECFETRVGDERLFMAVSADKMVNAEITLRDFVQTLTKTFAHLTTGLAIFDKHRKLKLFNPALTDLTSLPVDFLSARPTLFAFLDRLREKKMLPEPKDYKSWRQRFQELESAAENGTYEETWSLATGQTYRVVGRPHPDGAVAFLIEDISAEISLTRRFRAELDTGQAVIDSLDEAIAVFSPAGILTLSNAKYGQLWGTDPSTILGNLSIQDATRIWGNACAPSPVWGDAREFVCSMGERVEWSAELRMLDGRRLVCRFTPIAGGATLVGFRAMQAETRQEKESPGGKMPLLLTAETGGGS